MRDRLRRLRRLRPRRVSRTTVVTVTLVVLGIGLILVGGLSLQNRPSGSGFTYTGSWTLPELVRHVEAGDVVAISAAADGDGGIPQLVALTTGGQHVAVVAGVPAGDAADALRAMGYGRLLTAEAQSLSGAVGGTPSPLTTVFTILIIALVALGLMALAPQVLRLVREGRGRRFTTIGRPSGPSIEARVPSVRLDEVAGVDEAKTELLETIEFLRNPARFTAVGARPVRGVLLSGPPGTGKTMLAKAVAAEAGVPFLAASGSDFIEKYVGVGARRIRDLFAAARREGRAVVFVDEIDAIGRRRGGDNGSDERDATLNALLVEMDGFGPNDNVVVLAATNRPDVLDPAILRPGRFTRKVSVPMPDRDARLAILRVHAQGKPLSPDVDLPAVARKTYGFSGAMLSDLLNESAILAARRLSDVIEPRDVQAGWLKVAVGTSRVRSMDERERSIIAAHEAGHAVTGYLVGEKRRVEEISLYAHGEALGITVSSQEDNDLPSESDLQARLVALLGGRAAENLLFHDVTGGAANDFEKATNLAHVMVTRLGMGRDPSDTSRGATGRGVLSAVVVTDRVRPSSEVAAAQDRATRSILDAAYRRASEVLLANMGLLSRVAAYLYEQERMSGDELERVVAGALEPVDAQGWRAASSNPRPWDEIPGSFSRGEAAEEERRAEAETPVAAAAAIPVPTRNRRRSGLRNRVRRALPRPVHVALTRLVAALEGEPEDAASGH